MEPLKDSNTSMLCCGKEIEPQLGEIEEQVIAFWKCPSCDVLSHQVIGKIDSGKAEPTPNNFIKAPKDG